MWDRQFWLIQAMLVAIASFHLAGDQAGLLRSTPFPASETVGALLLPVGYAAATFGLGPSVATSLWAWVLWTPDLLLPDGRGQPWADLVELALVTAVAVLAGVGIERERAARSRAERAEGEHEQSERRYRTLLEAHASPTILVDAVGRVLLANPAARSLFGGSVAPGHPVADIGIEHGWLRMAPAAPGRPPDPGHDHGAAGPTIAHIHRRLPVLSVGDGDTPREFRVAATAVPVGASPGAGTTQVVLHEVTDEARLGRSARAYATAVVRAQEEERGRISRELHDEPVQRLVRLSQRLFAAERAVQMAPEHEPTPGTPQVPARSGADVAACLRDARSEALAVIAELRAIAKGLRPAVLDHLGLVAAVRALVAEAGSHVGPDVDARSGPTARPTLSVRGIPERLPAAVELAVFRIVQEALTNAERHAGASAITVTLDFREPGCTVAVADDGCGFAPDGAAGLGLRGMHERAAATGAALRVRSAAGRGTAVILRVPAAPTAGQRDASDTRELRELPRW